MNQFNGIGRLTKDPECRYTQGENPVCVARYTIAIDRVGVKKETDFISCVCFGKTAEFAEKYLHKGIKIMISGRIQTGSYTNKEGQKVFFLDVQVDRQEFTERKAVQEQKAEADASKENKTSVEEDLPQPYTPEEMGMTFYPEDGSEQEPEQNFMEFGMEM